MNVRIPSFESLEHRQLFSNWVSLSGQTLRIEGSATNDRITVSQSRDSLKITNARPGNIKTVIVPANRVRHMDIKTFAGDDKVFVRSTVTKVTTVIDGGSGNDFLSGGKRSDTLIGGDGNDTLDGNSGNDVLSGGSGNDRVYGGDGNDTLDGGAGSDRMYGGTGNDLFYAGDGEQDWITGNSGIDRVLTADGNDRFSQVEIVG